MNFSHVKTIIFDLDGTLLDTLTDLANSLNAALGQNGLPQHSVQNVRQFVGNGISKLVERAVENGVTHPLYHTVLEDMKSIYALRCREHTAPYEGISEMLRKLKDMGYRLAVVSNKPDVQVKKLCDELFSGLFEEAVGQKENVPLKPAPDALFQVMKNLGSTQQDTVYVGDSDVVILTAANAGIPCISVLWGFRDSDALKKAGGRCLIQNTEELYRLFRPCFAE